jgi:hypothetical protein
LQGSFHGCDEVEVLVDRGWCCQIGPFAIRGRVSNARTLGP